MKVLFFGSSEDSVIVLERLLSLQPTTYNLQLAAVITQPPRPVGRKQVITPSPTQMLAQKNNIPVLSFPSHPEKSWLYEHEETVIDTLEPFKADLLISAAYGQLIPSATIGSAKHGGINIHPSLLPRWRGADPVPWAILAGDHQTGVTLVTLSTEFDQGKILAQKKIPITEKDEHLMLRKKLFEIGSKLLVSELPKFLSGGIKGENQDNGKITSARRLKREDGFISWELIQQAMKGEKIEYASLPPFFKNILTHAQSESDKTISSNQVIVRDWSSVVERAIRALSPWPGVWTERTTTDGKKRMKILKGHVQEKDNRQFLILDMIQWEGKTPQSFQERAL